MSETTILTMCEQAPKYCDRIAEELNAESLYKIVPDDWRRPIIDGILASMYFYREVDMLTIRTILEILGFKDMHRALVKAEIKELVEEIEKEIEEIKRKADYEIERLRKLL